VHAATVPGQEFDGAQTLDRHRVAALELDLDVGGLGRDPAQFGALLRLSCCQVTCAPTPAGEPR